MAALLATLTDEPLMMPYAEEALSDRELHLAQVCYDTIQKDPERLSKTLPGYKVTEKTKQDVLAYCKHIIQERKEGRLLSTPYPLMGLELIEAHPSKRFTKSLYLVVDALTMSAAELFAAILQDNAAHRCIVIGEKSAGAGGTVESHTFMNSIGVRQLSLTTSFIRRLDGTPLENLGVMPTILLTPGVSDLKAQTLSVSLEENNL